VLGTATEVLRRIENEHLHGETASFELYQSGYIDDRHPGRPIMANLPTHVNSEAGPPAVSVLVRDRDDGVRPRLQLRFHFGAATSVGAPPLRVGRPPGSATLSDSTVEDHFDGLVGRESLAEILVEVGMPARNDEHIAGHSLLGLAAGNCHPLPGVSIGHGDAHRSLSSARPAKSYIYTPIGMAKARIVNFSGAYSWVGDDI
jgi:hypothetical protein